MYLTKESFNTNNCSLLSIPFILLIHESADFSSSAGAKMSLTLSAYLGSYDPSIRILTALDPENVVFLSSTTTSCII